MSRLLKSTRLIGVASVLTLTLLPVTAAQAANHASAAPGSEPPGTPGSFSQVSAVPHSTDAWAIGGNEAVGSATLVARRHHGHWQREKLSFGHKGSVSAIAAASSKLVWAAGAKGSSKHRPWIGRWHGHTFASVKLPGLTSGSFFALAASSTKNAWAVGEARKGNTSVAEHWNGKKWSAVPVPDSILSTVSTTSAKSAWATTVIGELLHWNGKTWKVSTTVPSSVTLTSVAASSAHAVTAVGYITSSQTQLTKTYILRFNGLFWHRVHSPNPFRNNQLLSVTAHGGSAWAVGFGVNKVGINRTLIMRSTGGKWRTQTSPIGGFSALFSVSAASAKRAFTVGSFRPRSDVSPITCFAAYDGHTWRAASAKI